MVKLCSILKNNTSLKFLDICANEIRVDGAIAIAEAIRENKTLQVIWPFPLLLLNLSDDISDNIPLISVPFFTFLYSCLIAVVLCACCHLFVHRRATPIPSLLTFAKITMLTMLRPRKCSSERSARLATRRIFARWSQHVRPLEQLPNALQWSLIASCNC